MVITRSLGTMVTYGFVEGGLAIDLEIASKLGASVVEILPEWRSLPDDHSLAVLLDDAVHAIDKSIEDVRARSQR